MTSPGVSTASKTLSHPTRPAAPRSRPSAVAQSAGPGRPHLRSEAPARVDERHCRRRAGLRLVEALLAQLAAGRQAVVARQLADAQVVVVDDLVAPALLRVVVTRDGAPAHERLLVAPARQRQQPARARQAVVADIIDKAVDALEFGAAGPREREVGIVAVGPRAHLEDHGEHRRLLKRLRCSRSRCRSGPARPERRRRSAPAGRPGSTVRRPR